MNRRPLCLVSRRQTDTERFPIENSVSPFVVNLSVWKFCLTFEVFAFVNWIKAILLASSLEKSLAIQMDWELLG